MTTGALTRQRQIATIREASHRLAGAARTLPGDGAIPGIGVAELLAEIAHAMQSASVELHSTREDQRWNPVCAVAARISEELTR